MKSKSVKTGFNSLIFLYQYIRNQRFLILFFIFLLIIDKIIIAYYPFFVRHILSMLADGDTNLFFFRIGLENFYLLILAFFFILFVQSIINYIQNYLNQFLSQSILKKLRIDLFKNILYQPLIFFEKKRTTHMLTLIVNDIQSLNSFFTDGFNHVFGNIILIFIILVLSFMINAYLAILTTLNILILAFILGFFKKKLKDNYQEIRKSIESLNSYLYSIIHGLGLIQIFNNQKIIFKEFKKIQNQFFKKYNKQNLYFSYYFSILDFFGNIYVILLILFSVFFFTFLEMKNLSELLVFIIYGPMIFRLIKTVMEQYMILQMGFVSLNRVHSFFLEYEILDRLKFRSQKKRLISGDITFENVHFSYKNKEEKVLEDISFKIQEGEKVAIFGKTGKGKTTIIKLMNRLYQPDKGSIFIGSKNMMSFDESEIENSFAYILQDVFIFTGTIYENIKLYNEAVSYKKVIKISKQIGLHDIVQRFKKGYHTKLGKNGLDISFGEKQLISFARVFLRPFKILILDEAFSNIDSLTQKVIFNNLKGFLQKKTIIFISHNRSIFSYVNRVLFLEDGKIIKEKNIKLFVKKK